MRTGHAGSLLPLIDTLFRISPYAREDIDLIAVGTGPGSFTGIRIGIATAKGLALALNRRLAGINTLDSIAQGALPSAMPVMPVIDARKSEVFCRPYTPEGHASGPAMNLRPEALREVIQQDTLFIGNAVPLYRDAFSAMLGSRYVEGPPHLWHPRASIIARIALQKALAGTLDPAQPQYVRPSDAALALERS